jgi:hypothetical protein
MTFKLPDNFPTFKQLENSPLRYRAVRGGWSRAGQFVNYR